MSSAVENALYERGCELIEAATGIAQCASDPGAARAVPAVLGCIEAALEQLCVAAGALQHASLVAALEEAQRAAGAARQAATVGR